MDQPVAKRRRFRFGLRTLLVIVTLAAVGSWGHWVAWPRLVIYLEQSKVEAQQAESKLERLDRSFTYFFS